MTTKNIRKLKFINVGIQNSLNTDFSNLTVENITIQNDISNSGSCFISNDISCNNFYLNSSSLANEYKYDWSGNSKLFLVKNLNNENDKTNNACDADISFIQNVRINQNLDVSNLIVYGDVSIYQASNIPYEIRGNLKTTKNVYADICLNLYNFNSNVLTNTEKLTKINYESIGEDTSSNFASKNSIALNNDFILIGDLCANVKNVGQIEISAGPGKDTRPEDRSC